jgi:hypothetical protein
VYINDTDLDMSELNRIGNIEYYLNQKGVCLHTWVNEKSLFV